MSGEVVPSQHWVGCGDVAVLQSENGAVGESPVQKSPVQKTFPASPGKNFRFSRRERFSHRGQPHWVNAVFVDSAIRTEGEAPAEPHSSLRRFLACLIRIKNPEPPSYRVCNCPALIQESNSLNRRSQRGRGTENSDPAKWIRFSGRIRDFQ